MTRSVDTRYKPRKWLARTEPDMTCDNPTIRSRFLPVLSMFAGALVYTVPPRGTFGIYDLTRRAAVIGTVAA